MGFSGGGSNVTLAHTHSSAIVQDGGALDFDDVTQASGAAGDITYSDGNALQLLNIGSASDVLQVNGAGLAPEWTTPAGGGVTQTLNSSDVGVEYSTASTTYVDIFFSQVLQAGSGHALCQSNWYCSTTGGILYGRWSFSTDGDQPPAAVHYDVANDFVSFSSVTATLGAQTCKTQWKSSSGTIYLMVNGNSYTWEIS